MGEVADLFATLGLRVDEGQWKKGDSRIATLRGALGGLGGKEAKSAADSLKKLGGAAEDAGGRGKRSFDSLGVAIGAVGAYLGGRAAYGALIKFNSTVEDSRDEIAGMLALTKHTHLSDELKSADVLMGNLQKRAATLPGTTAEYVQMLSLLTQPIIDAKLSMKDLEDITVGSVVAAKSLHLETGQSARDVEGALRGTFNSRDRLTTVLLGVRGFKGEEGRSRFNALSEAQRAAEVKAALTSPQLQELAAQQGKSFGGILSTLQDSLEQFFGKVGKPLFEGLGKAIKDFNGWLDENDATVKTLAASVGEVLGTAFQLLRVAVNGVVEVIGFFIEHSELGKAVLIALTATVIAFGVAAAASWIAAAAPVIAVIAVVTALVYALRWLLQHPGILRGKFAAAWNSVKETAASLWQSLKDIGNRILQFFVEDIPNAIVDAFTRAFEFIGNLPIIKQLIALVSKVKELLNSAGGNPDHAGLTQAQVDKLPASQLDYVEQMSRLGRPDQFLGQQGEFVAPGSAQARSGGGVSIGRVDVGDIHVNAPNADPGEVALATKRAFDEHFGNALRTTMDQL